MKTTLRRSLFFFLAALCVACHYDNPTPDPGAGEVSQYEAREWDGVKRAGVFYEIFVRSFADSNGDGVGDLAGITAKLDYLDDLGVAGIWLTPIYPGPSYHGYDVDDYTSIAPEYGTMADFDALVVAAHERGIRVVLDFVINHTSKFHPWFTNACSAESSPHRDWFLFSRNPAQDIAAGRIAMTKTYEPHQWHGVASGTVDYKYMGMFSDWMPEINYGSVESAENSPTFKAICDAARWWLARGVDGFRLDAVKHIYQDENSDENPRFLKKFYDELRQTKPDIYMVGEVLSEHDRVAPYYAGLPALFDFSSWWRLEYAIKNNHAKWYPKDLLAYRREYAAVRNDYIEATKLSNHDENRTRSALGGDLAKAKMAAAVLLTAVGSPYIYYGEEIGMVGDKSGPDGDKGVREPMMWAPAARDRYRPKWHQSTFSNDYNVGNVEKQSSDRRSIWRLYKKFMELRNTYPALATGEMELLPGFNDASEEGKNFMVFVRVKDSERLLVVHNVSPLAGTYTFPVAVHGPIADFGGVGVVRQGERYISASMPPYTTLICEL